jgi:hypothetical protein
LEEALDGGADMLPLVRAEALQTTAEIVYSNGDYRGGFSPEFRVREAAGDGLLQRRRALRGHPRREKTDRRLSRRNSRRSWPAMVTRPRSVGPVTTRPRAVHHRSAKRYEVWMHVVAQVSTRKPRRSRMGRLIVPASTVT